MHSSEPSDYVSYVMEPKVKDILIFESSKMANSPLIMAKRYKEQLDLALVNNGAILLRGFNIHALSEFNEFAQTLFVQSYRNMYSINTAY